MLAVAHSKSFASKVGVPMKVGKDFEAADKVRGKKAVAKLPERVKAKSS
jgi:hypothetical protein